MGERGTGSVRVLKAGFELGMLVAQWRYMLAHSPQGYWRKLKQAILLMTASLILGSSTQDSQHEYLDCALKTSAEFCCTPDEKHGQSLNLNNVVQILYFIINISIYMNIVFITRGPFALGPPPHGPQCSCTVCSYATEREHDPGSTSTPPMFKPKLRP